MTGSALYSFESHPGVAQQNIEAIVRLEQEADSARSFSERAAELVTRVAVRPWFFAAHTLLIGAWIAINIWGSRRPDPPPFPLMTTAIAVEALFVTLLVLAGQQHMSRVTERRAHLNLQVDLLVEREMTLAFRMIEQLAEHFQLPPIASLSQHADLKAPTDLEALIGKIDRTRQREEQKK